MTPRGELPVRGMPCPAHEGAAVPHHLFIAGHPDNETVAPIVFASAEGPNLVDVEGRRYLDWATCLNAPFGHSWRLDTKGLPVNAGNYMTLQRNRLISRLAALFPGMGGFQFRSSGTEAVEACLRYLLAAVDTQPHLAALSGCYHGLTRGAQSIMGTAAFCESARVLPFPTSEAAANVFEELHTLLQERPVILFLETVQGATLRRLPLSFLRGVGEMKQRHPRRLMVACDDMLASIRCGTWCSLSEGLMPDAIVAGKCWANGYPFSFFAVVPWVRQAAGDLLGTTSFGGSPIACEHAVHTIDRIERENLLGSIANWQAERGDAFHSRFAGSPGVQRTEWHGLLFGLELDRAESARRVAARAAANGVLVARLTRVLRCSPPLTVTAEELDQGLSVLSEALQGD